MKFRAFERAAREAFAEIPEEFLVGIDGLTVSQEHVRHPQDPDVSTLGECLTESYLSEWEGPETTRSRVVLYWGSFRAMAASDPEFDWEGEIWETLTHELRHHLESLASEAGLEGVDYAMDEEFKRFRGEDFDPFYYRRGDALGGGLFKVEQRYYLEIVDGARPELRGRGGEDGAEAGAAAPIRFEWAGSSWEVPAPAMMCDVRFVFVVWDMDDDGDDNDEESPPEEVEIVLVRRAPLRERLKRLVRWDTSVSVGEWEALATRAA